MMTTATSQIEFFPALDGHHLATRHYLSAGPSKGSVVLLHGIISHSDWYGGSASYLAKRGMDVYLVDRRGSGLNADRRGDIDRWTTWVNDVVRVCEARAAHGPVVLLGISWGGKLAPVVARQRPDLVAGVGMLCPGVFARQQPGVAKRTAVRLARPLKIDQRQVAIPLQQPKLFTDSPRWQGYIQTDPLTLRKITMRFAREDQQLTQYARQSPRWIHTPALLMLAGRDRIVDNRRTRQWFEKFASPDKTLHEYAQAAHTLEFEPDPEPFFDDLAAWAERVMARSQTKSPPLLPSHRPR